MGGRGREEKTSPPPSPNQRAGWQQWGMADNVFGGREGNERLAAAFGRGVEILIVERMNGEERMDGC
jgi:hypothetical protein